jgi:hypothetical protein
MIMANARVKTEMKGTGGGRWCPRAEAKKASKKARRTNDKKAQKEDLGRLFKP